VKRIILDTDIGTDVDDALALALAIGSPELQIEGVTTVHADAQLRARIAQRLLHLAGREDIPVIAGASLPIKKPIPESFHWNPILKGHEGVGILPSEDLTPSDDLKATADDAARFIIEKAADHRGELSIVTIGPVTNIGRALQIEPQLSDWICDLTLMGGMVDINRVEWPPVLETNLNADPGAAEIVFASGIPLTMVGFEVTTQVSLSPEQRQAMTDWKHPLSDALVILMEQMLVSFEDFSQEVGLSRDIFEGRTYMHDPLAVYTCFASHLVKVRRLHVQLEVHNQVLRTIPYDDRIPNMFVCVDVDAPNFVDFYIDRIRKLSSTSNSVADIQ